jgi:hypothetical protein
LIAQVNVDEVIVGDIEHAITLGRMCATVSEMLCDFGDYAGSADCAHKSLTIRREVRGPNHVR